MAQASSRGRGERSPKESATEVWELVRDYAKQETLDPLKGLLSFVKYGLLGAVTLAIGLIILVVGVLRLFQVETDDWLDGRLSIVPYVLAIVVMVGALMVAKAAMTSKKEV